MYQETRGLLYKTMLPSIGASHDQIAKGPDSFNKKDLGVIGEIINK